MVHSLPNWFARIDEPRLDESLAHWIRHLVAAPLDKSGQEVPGIVKLIFASETAETFLKRVREA